VGLSARGRREAAAVQVRSESHADSPGGPDVIGYQDKAHGMAVDAEDNVWITAANSATVMKISAEASC
jgi:hypothetical protein